MTRAKTLAKILAVPLTLLPQAVAGLIKKKGNAVYRISVVRAVGHFYNVTVRTKSVKKELAPQKTAKTDDVPAAGTTRSRWRKTITGKCTA